MTEENRVDRKTVFQGSDLVGDEENQSLDLPQDEAVTQDQAPIDENAIESGVNEMDDLKGISPVQSAVDTTQEHEDESVNVDQDVTDPRPQERSDEYGPIDAVTRMLTGRDDQLRHDQLEGDLDFEGYETVEDEIPWIADPAEVEEPKENDYREETAAEVSPSAVERDTADADRTDNVEEVEDAEAGGTALGWTGLVLSILSLFFLPVLMATAGIVTGYLAYRGGARSLGLWAIGVGVFSLLMSLFFIPITVR